MIQSKPVQDMQGAETHDVGRDHGLESSLLVLFFGQVNSFIVVQVEHVGQDVGHGRITLGKSERKLLLISGYSNSNHSPKAKAFEKVEGLDSVRLRDPSVVDDGDENGVDPAGGQESQESRQGDNTKDVLLKRQK